MSGDSDLRGESLKRSGSSFLALNYSPSKRRVQRKTRAGRRRRAIHAGRALENWAAKYGVELVELDQENLEGTIRFDTVLSEVKSTSEPHIRDVLEEGLEAWHHAGRDPRVFHRLRYRAEDVIYGDDSGEVGAIIG